MNDLPATPAASLNESLEELLRFVVNHPEQTLHRMAESAVLHWTRVAEGKDTVQPRLNPSGYLPAAFHFGMETRPENQIDPFSGPLRPETYSRAVTDRLAGLRERLERFFARDGYRNSADQCDALMVGLSRCSRFLGSRCIEAERAAPPAPPGERDPVDLFEGRGAGTLVYAVRRNLVFWEPFLNAAIVAWQQNNLEEYEHALRRLARELDDGPPRDLPHPPGYPFRAQHKPRQKTAVHTPEPRPMRRKSMFTLRFNQLAKRLESSDGPPLRVLLQLTTEMQQFIQMAERNLYLVAGEPTFLESSRAGISTIRGAPSNHPLLLDTTDFFKKAMLFANGTYTVAGGGLDTMYMHLRQLERLFRHQHWAGSKGVRAPLERCLIGWEENRWDAFTREMLEAATLLRGGGEG